LSILAPLPQSPCLLFHPTPHLWWVRKIIKRKSTCNGCWAVLEKESKLWGIGSWGIVTISLALKALEKYLYRDTIVGSYHCGNPLRVCHNGG